MSCGETAVRNRMRAYLEGEQRAEVDDLPAPAGDHVLPSGLGEQPDGFEVDIEDLLVSTHRVAQRAQRYGESGEGIVRVGNRSIEGRCGQTGGEWMRAEFEMSDTVARRG